MSQLKNEAHHFIDLLSLVKLTEVKLYTLLDHFGTVGSIRKAKEHELSMLVGPDIAHHIASLKDCDTRKKIYDTVDRLGISIIPYYAPEYPSCLKTIPNFPPVLFVRGELRESDELAIAVIGTRGATVYGKSIAEKFVAEFIAHGVTIVSGMARGIDTAAHTSALKNGGRTIAVLGCGVDRCYPPENEDLMRSIINQGAVISEFAIGTLPLAQNFPKRNRIVSGLSKAVVAIEAKEKSGVMNTVNWAAHQNRDVFAIPGNIYSKASSGTNRLIKEGAIPVTSAGEILENLGICHQTQERAVSQVKMNNAEQRVWQHLSFEPIYLDILSEQLSQSTGSILNILLKLEIKGLVKQLPGMMFVKTYNR